MASEEPDRIRTKPGFKRLERWMRLRTARAFEGKRVLLVWAVQDSYQIEFCGVVLAGARGAGADVLVINVDSRDGDVWPEPEPFAFPLAQIKSIEEL